MKVNKKPFYPIEDWERKLTNQLMINFPTLTENGKRKPKNRELKKKSYKDSFKAESSTVSIY